MNGRENIFSRWLGASKTSLVASINDLKDKEMSGARLSHEEKAALSNFERYRAGILNACVSEDAFHQKMRQLHVVANLGDWREFLKEDFFR